MNKILLEFHNNSHKLNSLVLQVSIAAWISMYSIWHHLKDELLYYILSVLFILSTLI